MPKNNSSKQEEIKISDSDLSLLTSANKDLSELEEIYGTLVSGFMCSPPLKEAQQNVEIAKLAFQRIGSHILKKHGLGGPDAIEWNIDFESGKIKRKVD